MAKRIFRGDLSVATIQETYHECCFGKLEPSKISANVDTWRRLMHKVIDICDPRYLVSQINNAKIVYDPSIPEGVLDYCVPENDEKYGALLYLETRDV